MIAVSVLGVGARARAVRHEGNFVGKKRLECKIHHVGGQNGKTQLGPKVTFSRRLIISATRDTCRPSGRYRGRRVNIATEFRGVRGVLFYSPCTRSVARLSMDCSAGLLPDVIGSSINEIGGVIDQRIQRISLASLLW